MKHFTIPIKLWVSPAMYADLAAEARRRDWSVPHVIRWVIEHSPDFQPPTQRKPPPQQHPSSRPRKGE